jgi:ketosteroid isomerase-like protein
MSVTNAQAPGGSELYQTLKEKDSVLFHAAFNACDPVTMKTLMTEDFEFYHDRGGFTDGRDAFLKPVQAQCSHRDPEAPQSARRILVSGSLEVFPLYKDGELYGAIQHGIHHFKFLNDKKEYQKGDIARFTHVWVREDNDWKIKRELSYDHHGQE